MESRTRDQRATGFGSYLPPLAVFLSLAILASAIAWVSLQLRKGLRTQMAGRDAEALAAVVMAQSYDPDDTGGLVTLEEPAGQLQAVLNASRLRGVIAVRLFAPDGAFQSAFPVNVQESDLAPSDIESLARGSKLSRFHPQARPGDLYYWRSQAERTVSTNLVPLLEVLVPIQDRELGPTLGIAQFFIDGRNLALEYVQLDARLLRHSLLVFLLSGGVAALSLIWAFHRLQRTHRVLARRTADLAAANRELTLAAKTSAVGAVASQLIHGLRSPLFGLQSFLDSRKPGEGTGDQDWHVAAETARQMQTLIGDVVRVLNEGKGITQYEITLEEFVQVLRERLTPAALSARVKLEIQLEAAGVFPNRVANLVLLIAENLIQNGLQATAADRIVICTLSAKDSHVALVVADQGAGVPESVRNRLFTPCQSTKPGGSGIGLALCKQLANHLGADLVLRRTGPQGSEFVLLLPRTLLTQLETPSSAAERAMMP